MVDTRQPSKLFPVVDYYDNICLYYDAKGDSLVPPYFLNPVPEIDEGRFVYRGRTEVRVRMHIQVASVCFCAAPSHRPQTNCAIFFFSGFR